MKSLVVLAFFCGCVGVSLTQMTCTEGIRQELQACVASFDQNKNDMTGNQQIKCDAARSFIWCIEGKEHCISQFGYDKQLMEAKQIKNSYPCYDVVSSGSKSHLYLPTFVIAALMVYFV